MHSRLPPADPPSSGPMNWRASVEQDPMIATTTSTRASPLPEGQALRSGHRPAFPSHQEFAAVPTTSTGDIEGRHLSGNRSAKSAVAEWFIRWGPNLSALLVILIGIGSAAGLYLWFHSVEEQNFSRDFESLSRISVRSLETVMSVRCFQHLRNLAAFGYAVPELTRDTLATFAQHSSFDAKVLYNLAFFLVVQQGQQAAVEQHFNVSIWNSPGSDELVKNDTILVLPILIHPYEDRNTDRFFGWNVLSDPTRRALILEVMETNSWSISQPIRFKDTGNPGFITCHTVREREPTPATPFTKYLASVGIAFTDLFSTTLNQRLKSPQESDVAVYITFESGERVFEYVPPQNTSAAQLDTRRTLHLQFEGFSAKWLVDFVPTRRYVKRFQTPVPWVVLGSTLAVFFILAYAARRGMARFIASQQMMKKLRVQDTLLESLQEYSKAIIQAIPDGVVMLDKDGWIIGINDAALEMTGFDLVDFAKPKKIDLLLAPAPDGENRASETGRDGDEREGGENESETDDDEEEETNPLLSPRPHGGSEPSNTPLNQVNASNEPQGSSSSHARNGTAATKNQLEPGNRQTRMRRKDGTVFIAQVTVSNVNDGSPEGERVGTSSPAPAPAPAPAAATSTDPAPSAEPADSTFSPTIDRPAEPSPAIPPQLWSRQSSSGMMCRLEVTRPVPPLLHRLSSNNRVGVTTPVRPPSCDIESQHATTSSPSPPATTRSPTPPPPPTTTNLRSTRQLAQVYMFYDCTEKVETLRAVAQMERQAIQAAKSKHQLLEFLVRCMMDPLRQLKNDMKAIQDAVVEAHRATAAAAVQGGEGAGANEQEFQGVDDEAGGGNGELEVSEAEVREARMAAEHIVRVLEDIAGFTDIRLNSEPGANGYGAGDRVDAVPSPGTLAHFVTSCILVQDMMDLLADRRIQFTTNANPPQANIMVPGILLDAQTRANVANILGRLLVLGATSARPDGLMTMAVELQHLRQVAATGAFQITVMLTISHFDPSLPQSTALDLTQLNISLSTSTLTPGQDGTTRGNKFVNIGLTWAALLKMVDRMGGQVEQTRVSIQAGLVVVVSLPLPVAL